MLSLVVESWTWWSFVILVTICRIVSRTIHFGSIRKLQVDDWLMLCTLAFYTTLIVTINIVADADTNLFPAGFDVGDLTATDKSRRIFGSKLVLVVEQSQIMTVWGVKACILIMYARLTVGRTENVAIKCLAAYVAFGLVFMEIFYFGVWCRPFHNYWAVPTPNKQCNTAINHLITNAVFNVSSDTILLIIALPMFIRSRLPARKKIALICVFGLGVFVILCAILNKYYSFTDPFGSEWTFWYVRESSTALLTANLPFMWSLIRRIFPFKALETTTANTYATTRLSRVRKGSCNALHSGIDPEFGRKLSNSRAWDSADSPSGAFKEEPELCFLTTPPSLEDSWGSLETTAVTTPTKCVLRDAP
ncbi:hypothetical protein BDV97DRAFT_47480 [Delphinella strobiligena]|nr:hypothetical protein BDV97DRAFT_47480 [Delphinella strobiligena]